MRSRRETAAKLGELLASRGKLDREVLLRALRLQRTAGGRLGTCLLELEAVAEEDLLHVLSDQLKVPFLEADDLRSVAEETLRLVPPKTASKLGAIPVRASGSQLTIAMLDPLDLAGLDELSFVSGRRIRPHVALELRLQEALARHYHLDIASRYVKLADRLNRARFLWREGEVAAGSEERPAAATAPSEPAATPVAAAAVAKSPAPATAPGDEMPRRAPSPAPPPLPPWPSPPSPPPEEIPAPRRDLPAPPAARPVLAVAAALERLVNPSDRDAIADTLAEFLTGRTDLSLTLMLRREEAAGWRGHGLPKNIIAAVRLPLSEPSIVLALRDGAPQHRGALPPLRGNEPLIAALGSDFNDLLALPLQVRDRIVGAVLAVNRRAPLDPGVVEDLHRLAAKASGALEVLVLRQKLQKS